MNTPPKKPWNLENYEKYSIRYFQNDNRNFWNQVQKRLDFVYILPCGEDEVDDFIKNDPNLQALDKLSNKPFICSTIAAKGVEYDNVIVYGFGRNFPPYEGVVNTNSSSDVEAKYHFHKFYVAASRAKKTLFFVDNLLPEQDPFWRLFLETPHKETNADIALTLSTELNISTTIDEESLKANADTVKNQASRLKTIGRYQVLLHNIIVSKC